MTYPLKNWNKIKRGYRFGEKTFYSARHLGTDYLVPEGTPVYAPYDCEIVKTGDFPEGGKTIHVRFEHEKRGKLIMRCLHLGKLPPKGKYKEGDILAYTGNTGKYTKGPHLHLDISRNRVEVKNFGNFIDPKKIFSKIHI